jgi:hypothetical protein
MQLGKTDYGWDFACSDNNDILASLDNTLTLLFYSILIWLIVGPNWLRIVFWLLWNGVCFTLFWIVGPNSLCVLSWLLRNPWHLGYFWMVFVLHVGLYFTLFSVGGLLDPTHYVRYNGCQHQWHLGYFWMVFALHIDFNFVWWIVGPNSFCVLSRLLMEL